MKELSRKTDGAEGEYFLPGEEHIWKKHRKVKYQVRKILFEIRISFLCGHFGGMETIKILHRVGDYFLPDGEEELIKIESNFSPVPS